MATESKTRVLVTAAVVCLVCSVFVSAAAVSLKPIQKQAATEDRKRNIVSVLGLYQPGDDLDEAFAKVTPKAIDLDTGELTDAVDPLQFDMFAAAKKPETGAPIPDEQDIASINYRPKYATVYFLYAEDGSVKDVVVPIQGYGLWSTMYAFLAVEGDGQTIKGVNFYQQSETPGLGGEVTNPNWSGTWAGKKIYDEGGDVEFRLVKGGVNPSSPEAAYHVDALSGATLTSNGVTNLMHYWMSAAGYKPFLRRVGDGELSRDKSVALAN